MKVVLSPNPYRDRGLKAAQAAEKILKAAGVEINRKMLAELAVNNEAAFAQLVEMAKKANG